MSKYLGIAYNLRLPPELKEKIQESAKQLNRSMNADIVARLEKSFEPEINVSETFEFESMKSAYLKQTEELKAQLEAQANKLTEQYNLLAEQQLKQAAILQEIIEFQEWKKSKKPT